MSAFARLLLDTAKGSGSGIVTATRGKLRRLFCIEEGWLVFATSNLVEEQYAEYLVRTGVLAPAERAQAVEAASKTGKKVAAILVEGGVPPYLRLRTAQEGLVREILSSTLEWPDGSFAGESGLPRLTGEITLRLSVKAILVDHARQNPGSLDALRVRIGPPNLSPIVVPGDPGIELDKLGNYLLHRCDGSVELGVLVEGSPEDEVATLRRVYGYLLAGLLEREDRATREARTRRREADLTREECLGRLTLSSSHEHYAVLGLDRSARREQIRDAYYALARRYHPDRFRSGELTDLLPRFEEFFARVTAAYNTLYDPEMRAEYDRQAEAPAAAADTRAGDTGYIARQNFLRGKVAAQHRRYAEAVTFLENAIQQDPGQAEYHLELGLVQARNPRFRAEAERHLLQAVNLAPTLVEGYVALGQMYLKTGRGGRAAKMAREALRWEPGHVEASKLLRDAASAPDEDEARRA
jgi:tetratricopeptide (TPR) repeat protein